MNPLKDCLAEHVTTNEEEQQNILSSFGSLSLGKGKNFLNSGSVCRQMAYIESGYVRMFNIADGKEITLWIGSAGTFITSVSSFVFETPSYWNIQAISDCSLQVITRKDHIALCKSQPKWLEFDNHLLARSFSLLEQNMFSQLHMTAKQRFEALMADNPAMFNQVPLQHIASMLGITPETLSRLRKS